MKKNSVWLVAISAFLLSAAPAFSADDPAEDFEPPLVSGGAVVDELQIPQPPAVVEESPVLPAAASEPASDPGLKPASAVLPPVVPAVTSPSMPAPASGSKKPQAGSGVINTYHSLDEVIGKINRASASLAGIQDSSGHAASAAQYLQKALEELKAAKR